MIKVALQILSLLVSVAGLIIKFLEWKTKRKEVKLHKKIKQLQETKNAKAAPCVETEEAAPSTTAKRQ